MSLTLTTLTRTLTARFKPHRTEAIARIRFNVFSFLVLLLVTSIVPGLPSLPTAIATVAGEVVHYHHHVADEGEGVWGWVCLVEASLTAIFLFNIFESLYALKYPRAPSPTPSSSSASSLGLKRANQGSQPKKIFDGVHIGSTAGSTGSSSSPQPQKPFSFATSLSGSNGRITFTLIEVPGQEVTVEMKYQLLNPAPNFMEVVEEARSVVLAGGTMSPISDVINQLFYSVPVDRITSFSCGHVIPEENLQTMVVAKGPRGTDLDFKAGTWQGNSAVISELGQILYNYACVVPAGVIVFFPSYSFLNTAKDVWAKNKTLDRFGTKKAVFFEPQESTDVDNVLRDYAKAVHSPPQTDKKGGGALLFAVIGAKLSEGLNFADDLARAVVIVGLPFPNLGSPELRERMKYVKMLEQKNGLTKEAGKKDAAAELYENMCMNAVNQSIGRAIRHRNDWASLLLLDRRYATPSIRNKLPKWIGRKLVVCEAFGQTVKDLAAFNAQRRKQSAQIP
ncbi:hypothetical protein NMY22_g19964 [Coprinellus aureogranulatus]|nr:hypothetical protein NMY22_g19964 [Coprinellus aureogranulatus]